MEIPAEYLKITSEKIANHIYFALNIKSIEELKNYQAQDLEKLSSNIDCINSPLGYYPKSKTFEHILNKLQSKDYLYIETDKKYLDLIKRQTESDIQYVLYKKLIVKKDKSENFNDYLIIDTETLKSYKADYNDMSKVRLRNSEINTWVEDHGIFYKKINEIFTEKNKNNLPLEHFRQKYGTDDHDRQCRYCKIYESQINTLILKNKIFTNRLYSRGRKMEIDKKKASKGYVEDNIALACYWCNNAKTDEFTKKEFKLISKAIRKIWNKRLKTRVLINNKLNPNNKI